MIRSDTVMLWMTHQQPNTTEQQQTKSIYKHMEGEKKSQIKLYAAVFFQSVSESYYQSGKSFALAHTPIWCHPNPGK